MKSRGGKLFSSFLKGFARIEFLYRKKHFSCLETKIGAETIPQIYWISCSNSKYDQQGWIEPNLISELGHCRKYRGNYRKRKSEEV